jgi:hypothetical protein
VSGWVTCSGKTFVPYASPPQNSLFWTQSIDSIQQNENYKSSTLSGVLGYVRLG